MKTHPPLLSVGVPIHNEDQYICETLASLSAFEYSNIEFIISDNASSDETFNLCRQHTEHDHRFTLIRSEQNQGSFWNFKNVLSLAKGNYFMWAGGHDKWDKKFPQKCIEILEVDKSVVLVYPKTVFFDETTNYLSTDSYDSTNLGPFLAFRKLLWTLDSCNMFHGIFRKTVLSNLISFQRPIVGTDFVLLAEVSLRGKIIQLSDELFFRRLTQKNETSTQHYLRAGVETGVLQNKKIILTEFINDQSLNLKKMLISVVWHSNMRFYDKLLGVLTAITFMATVQGAGSNLSKKIFRTLAWYIYRLSIIDFKYWENNKQFFQKDRFKVHKQ